MITAEYELLIEQMLQVWGGEYKAPKVALTIHSNLENRSIRMTSVSGSLHDTTIRILILKQNKLFVNF